MKKLEIDLADECIAGIDNVADRVESAIKNYTNMVTEDNPEHCSDKYRVTVTIELMHGWQSSEVKE